MSGNKVPRSTVMAATKSIILFTSSSASRESHVNDGADCAVGALHYPSQFHVFEGWVHHAVYAAFFAWLTRAGYTVAGASTLALELPTAILAAGHCFPAARADLLYGCAFFAVRVAFHFYLLVKWVAMRDPPIALWPCTAATLLLHAFWFFKWCRSYAKQRAKEQGG